MPRHGLSTCHVPDSHGSAFVDLGAEGLGLGGNAYLVSDLADAHVSQRVAVQLHQVGAIDVVCGEKLDVLGAVDAPQPFGDAALVPAPDRARGLEVVGELGLGGAGEEAVVLAGRSHAVGGRILGSWVWRLAEKSHGDGRMRGLTAG